MELCAQCATDEGPFYGGVCITCYNKQMEKKEEKQVKTDEKGLPTFGTVEEMLAFAEKVSKGKKAPAKKAPAKKASKPAPAISVAEKQAQPEVENELVYQVISFYTRKLSTFSETLRDARDEKKLRNVNIIVLAHDHVFNVDCNDNCRQV